MYLVLTTNQFHVMSITKFWKKKFQNVPYSTLMLDLKMNQLTWKYQSNE